MYCSHCGKKVEDVMLFCPFCGEAIVVPEQDDVSMPGEREDDAPAADARPEETDLADPGAETVSEPADADGAPQEGDAAAELLNWNRERRIIASPYEAPADRDSPSFAPLEFDDDEPAEDWREDIARRKQENAPERHAPDVHRPESAPANLDGHAPKLEESPEHPGMARRSANTFVPPKAMDPDDLFLDGVEDSRDRYDDYDDYDGNDDYDDVDEDEDYVYEDEREGSFFMRHIRGIVGLTLFFVLAIMFVVYAFSDSGQRSLAKANLAWKADIYGSLGYQYFQNQQYDDAGLYYERALARRPDSYSYASSAAMAYYTGGNNGKAVAMLKKCIEIDASRVEPYIYLLNIYPDAAGRPYDLTQLIKKGYEITGDSRIRIDE